MRIKPKVLWFQGVTCNGNTHSLLCANPSRLELFLNCFDLIYHPSLTTDANLLDIIDSDEKIDFLLIEGAISNNTNFFSISNSSTHDLLNALVAKSTYIIAVGSCASYGGVHAKFELNEGMTGVQNSLEKKIASKLKHKVINLTGCPAHPEWILQTMFIIKQKGKIQLDEEQRPVEMYSSLAHHGCTRNEYFEWKVESDHYGTKEGCLFYDQGCRGPMTKSSCNKILWNDVNSKTRVGMPCIGCTETDFPRDNMLETKKHIGIPFETPLGISKRAYLSLTGVAKTFKIDRLEDKLIKYD